MPSQRHDAWVTLFRNRPELAPELIKKALGVELPEYAETRIESAEISEVQPAEYRADLVVMLSDGKPVLAIVLEVQLDRDPDKPYVWPAYVTGLRKRFRCPVCLLMVSPNEKIARWAANAIDLGGANRFTPFVLGPSRIPLVTGPNDAVEDPELAVLSAMAHGGSDDTDVALAIATAALNAAAQLDYVRSLFYGDLVLASLSEAARKALQAMDPAKYEFQSEFAKRFLAEGRQEGRAKGRFEGRAEIVLKQLTLRFGPLSGDLTDRVKAANVEELDQLAERVLTANSLDDVFA